MDLLNINTTDKNQISSVLKSQYIDSMKEYQDKDIFRIGRKGAKIIANKSFDSSGRFLDYNRLKITLKPHYYKNNEIHNGDIFTSHQAIETLNDISDKLNIKRKDLFRPTSLDNGINIIPEEFDTKNVVSQSLYYGKKPFLIPYSHLPYFKTTKEMSTHPTVGAKIYNKGIQYPDYIHPNTMRFENIFATHSKLKSQFGITSFADFFDIKVHKNCANYLLKSWDSVLILDIINTDIDIYNPAYYEDRRHYRNGLRSARIDYYKKEGYCHRELKKLLEYNLELCNRKMQIPTLIDSWNLHQSKQNDIVGICTKKICDVTGYDISMQKPNSKYLCLVGIRHYKKSFPDMYHQLEENYLSDRMTNTSAEERIYYIAHNIRNIDSNRRNNRIRFEQLHYPQSQLQFDFNEK